MTAAAKRQAPAVRERPILFGPAMVRAILEGRKTQTRRAINPRWWRCLDSEDQRDRASALRQCPFGVPGDRLWVRETWAWPGEEDVLYRASHQHIQDKMRSDPLYPQFNWRPSIHMPRWASRLTLEVTAVRVQRLQEISEEDAREEGASEVPIAIDVVDGHESRYQFSRLWDSIHGEGAWESNPWVWALTFRRLP
jgi:hypothetical protein